MLGCKSAGTAYLRLIISSMFLKSAKPIGDFKRIGLERIGQDRFWLYPQKADQVSRPNKLSLQTLTVVL